MSNEFYAYGEQWADVEAVMRLHAVKRWHMIDTTRVQSLAEHSANVATLVYVIAATEPGMFFDSAAYLAGKALLHDIAEVFTGDIPSHSKQHLGGIRALEQNTTPDVFQHRLDANEKALIKICDLADGIRFIRLHGVDVTSRHAREGLEVKFKALTDEVTKMWPPEVANHVCARAYFYAYEHS